MTLKRREVIAGLGALSLMSARARASTPATVVATTGMIGDTARRIGGGDVTSLLGPGLDPHSYRPTRSDIAALSRADLVLWHGLRLEAQMVDFLTDLSRKTRVVAVAESLPSSALLADPDHADRFDPHVWMDPRLWATVAEAVTAALAEAGIDQAAAGGAAFATELDALHAYSTEVLTSVAADRRVLVTAHDAFGYFGAAYGFEVLGIQGISTESEAGLARIGELVHLLVDRGIGAVFVESSVSDRSIRALIEGADARGHAVAIGGELYSDAMGPDGSYEGTYLGMIDHNVTTIARALGGTAPAGGMSGRLAGAA